MRLRERKAESERERERERKERKKLASMIEQIYQTGTTSIGHKGL